MQSLAGANIEGKLPQLRHLDISHNWENTRDLFAHSAQWNHLDIFNNFQAKISDLFTNSNNKYIFGFTGSLSALFTHRFPGLNTLILSKCKLNSNDLQSLARANV